VPDRQVGEVVTALVGTQQVSRQFGIADQSRKLPAVLPDRQQRPFRGVHGLATFRIGQPPRQRLFIGQFKVGDFEPAGGPVGAGQRHRRQFTCAGAPPPDSVQPSQFPGGMGGQPTSQLARAKALTSQLETRTHRSIVDREGLQQPVAQHPELQCVEEPMNSVAVVASRSQVVQADRQSQPPH